MGIIASIKAVRSHREPTRSDLERKLQETYGQPHIENDELYDFGVYIDSWPFLARTFARDDAGSRVDPYGPSNSPLLWGVRGRHMVTSGDDVIYLNSPEDARAILGHIDALPQSYVSDLFRAEAETIVQEYLAEGYGLEQAHGLVGDVEAKHPIALWDEIVMFYRRATAEGRYVVGVIGLG